MSKMAWYEERREKCPDCGVGVGQAHLDGCDVERCSVCYTQRLSCECEGHDPQASYWTGIWPGVAECIELGMYSRLIPYRGWIQCGPDEPEAGPDLNSLQEIYVGLRPWPEQWKDKPKPLALQREENR